MEILISGGADGLIVVWNIQSGEVIATVGAHTRGVLDLAIDPASYKSRRGGTEGALPEHVKLFSASSLGDIKCWNVSGSRIFEITGDDEEKNGFSKKGDGRGTAVGVHETSVNRLHFPGDACPPLTPNSNEGSEEEEEREESVNADLYTASSDNTSQFLPRSARFQAPATVMKHPDWVRDVIAMPELGMVVTACRDEEVRIWEIEQEDIDTREASKKREATLLGTLSGHHDSVEAMAFVRPEKNTRAVRLVSGGLDCTLRVWSLEHDAIETHEKEWRKWARKNGVTDAGTGDEDETDDEDEEDAVAQVDAKPQLAAGVRFDSKKMTTTEEEDAELAALMAELEND